MDVRSTARRTRFSLLLAALLGLIASLGVAPARAAVPFVQIDSSGPIEHVYLGNELSCQLKLLGDTLLSTYPQTTIPGDCGTFLRTGGTLYYPNFPAHGSTATSALPAPKTFYTPVSQTPVTGSGTSGDPYTATTVADAGATGLHISQTDSYVTGDNFYLSQITVSNSGASTQNAALYHAADCYLAGSDQGFGYVPGADAVFCSANANNSPSGRIIGFEPADAASSGATYLETTYNLVWAAINGSPFANTCACTSFIDNGAGLEWDISVPASAQVTRQVRTTLFAPPRFSVADSHVTEGNTPLSRGTPLPTNMRVTVSLAAPTDHAVAVHYATSDDTATAPADYSATSGTLHFAAGKTRKVILVPINGDVVDEPSENLTVTLSNPTGGATIEDGTATGRIIDDDGPPSLTIADAARPEGQVIHFPVTLTGPSGKTVRVHYQTADGTATAGEDYTSKSANLTFDPGDTNQTINIRTIHNGFQQGDVTFTVDLSGPVNVVLGNSSATGTVQEIDPD